MKPPFEFWKKRLQKTENKTDFKASSIFEKHISSRPWSTWYSLAFLWFYEINFRFTSLRNHETSKSSRKKGFCRYIGLILSRFSTLWVFLVLLGFQNHIVEESKHISKLGLDSISEINRFLKGKWIFWFHQDFKFDNLSKFRCGSIKWFFIIILLPRHF